jgi:hypothetical protein
MKHRIVSFMVGAATTLLMAAAGCSTQGPQSTKAAQHAARTDSLLSRCGFKSIPVSTPQQIQQAQSLPAGKLSMVQRNGATYYVYPVLAGNRLLVGKQAQYDAYQNARTNAEEDKQFDAISKRDPSVAKYNNEAELLIGNSSSAGWDAGWGSWDEN